MDTTPLGAQSGLPNGNFLNILILVYFIKTKDYKAINNVFRKFLIFNVQKDQKGVLVTLFWIIAVLRNPLSQQLIINIYEVGRQNNDLVFEWLI